jgi:prepilin-type N-terminal cleavage/methylation domain-containing protein
MPIASCRPNPRHAGFSLIELSIVVVILSLVATLGLEVAAQYLERTAYYSTMEKMTVVDKAIADFRRVNGYLPCPGSEAQTLANTCYGKQYNGTSGCNNTTGSCNANTMASGAIYFGDVPARDLGLPLSYMLDAYGSKIRYFVTAGMVNTSSYYNTADGIQVRSGKLDATCGGSSDRCQSRGGAAYLLNSAGRDKRGARQKSGYIETVCLPAPTTSYDGKIDTANCRAGNNPSLSYSVPLNAFYDSRYNSGAIEDNFFDDVVRWRSKGML